MDEFRITIDTSNILIIRDANDDLLFREALHKRKQAPALISRVIKKALGGPKQLKLPGYPWC